MSVLAGRRSSKRLMHSDGPSARRSIGLLVTSLNMPLEPGPRLERLAEKAENAQSVASEEFDE